MIFRLLTATALFAAGILFFTGGAAKYIKDYREMDEKEKSNIKIRPLCKNISLVFFAAAVLFAVAAFSETFGQTYFKWCIIAWFVLGFADVVYIGKSKRFVYRKAVDKMKDRR